MNESKECSTVHPKNGTEKSMNDCNAFEALTASGLKMLVEATKKSNNLPFGRARQLYESYPGFHNVMKTQLECILSELSTIINQTNCKGNICKKDDEDKFEMIVDANDSLLENVGIALDELCGISKNVKSNFIEKRVEFAKASWNRNKSNKITSKAASQLLNSIFNQTKNIEKPQTKFKDKVNNDSDVPFEPRIKYKHNLLKPLSSILQTTDDGICHFTHPYEFELNKFTPPKEQLTNQPPMLYKPLDETPLVLVTGVEDVNQMVNDLEKHSEIAVDVEHHSYRSFQGFTCLLQISTRDVDYIVDTLTLRSELELLNKVFTNPSIVKVFHGADLDIIWLQRDLSVYVVNMFDTHQAAKRLNFPKLSLAYLLSHYCNVDAQKHFQLADWRIRPLPQELITYARQDTHYLLFIYDNLRNALIEKANNQTNLLEAVISESTTICLKTYLKPRFDEDGYLDMYRRSKKLFDNRQKSALQQLFRWRDRFARECDESYAYVLPDHMMLNISEVLPREAQGILACCSPVPVPVRQNLMALHQIILKAREQPLLKPILEEQKFHRHTSSATSPDNPLQCPHDLNHEADFRDDLPVLCTASSEPVPPESAASCSLRCSAPVVTVFESSRGPSGGRAFAEPAVHFTPYYLYQLSKKFSESIEMRKLNKSKGDSDEVQVKPEVRGSAQPALTPAEPSDRRDRTQDDKSGTSQREDGEVSVSKETEVGEKRVDAEEQVTTKSQKRKIEDVKDCSAKKQKKEAAAVTVASVKEEKSGPKLDRKKKISRKERKQNRNREKQFQPFDYSSVDFEKFKSSPVTSSKRVEKIRKPRKKTAKNFRISI